MVSVRQGHHQVTQLLSELQRTRQSPASKASTCAACGSTSGSLSLSECDAVYVGWSLYTLHASK